MHGVRPSSIGRSAHTWVVYLRDLRVLSRWPGKDPSRTAVTTPRSIHSLRNPLATRLYRKAGDLYLVQRVLGHRLITPTEIHTRAGDDVLRRAEAAT